ncbi:MAG: primosomal protein N' [Bacteroidetes bacterium]|nr:primosomal protein N' [Bacteroidota bacterium]
MFVDVILPLPVPGLFTYSVPPELDDQVESGKRVVVQFGKHKIYSGLIHTVHSVPPKDIHPKEILSVPDSIPLVNPIQIAFWEWMASYYMSTLGEVMTASLPSALKLSSESKIVINPSFTGDISLLNEKEYLVALALQNQEELTITDVSMIVRQGKVIPLIKNLIEKQVISIREELVEQYRPKIENFVRLTDKFRDDTALNKLFDELNKRAFKQLELLVSYIKLSSGGRAGFDDIRRIDLLKSVKASASQLDSLIKKKIFETIEKKTSRLGEFQSNLTADTITLTDHQRKAFDQIKETFRHKDIVLLHGITSSGKTEMYIKLIQEYLDAGKQVLYLLPEITLTTQIISRLRKYFGSKIGVYHSRYNENERVEIWNAVVKNCLSKPVNQNHQVILGARSALFLPYDNLGLVIIDEEHDTSYKQQDPAPRYQARDSALYLARLHGAKTLLGSATPSVESYHNALSEKYGLVELTERYGGIQLPEISVVDIKAETRRKQMQSIFSQFLLDHIHHALLNHEQAILFQNRRGFSLRIECDTCNWVPQCKNCDVTLIYHKKSNHLRCHYCGYTMYVPGKCPLCKNTRLIMQGFGTEKVEEELAVFFPDAAITRMDLDTTKTRYAHQRIINDLEARKIDILVGTQMVTKGLDFDNVNMVCILNADNMLTFPDFRAHERSFQMMAQVSGRSGRKNKRGKVIIQTANPQHPVIKDVVENDYLSMYNREIMQRQKFKYPPFYRLVLVKLQHRDLNLLNKAAEVLAAQLRQRFPKRILGPEYPLISRIKNLYIKQVMIKIERTESASAMKTEISKLIDKFQTALEYKPVRVIINVDPI